MRRAAAAAVGLFALITAYVALVPAPEITPDQVRARALAAAPDWFRYDEDIKGQIGAAPVAAWHGAPEWVRIGPGGAEIAFTVTGAWRDYGAPLPILARDPFGKVHLANAGRWEDDLFVYRLPELADAGIPWIELRYRRHETRVQIGTDGYGTAPDLGQR